MRTSFVPAAAVLLCASGSPQAEERSVRDGLLPVPRADSDRPLARASLAFVVSVCLADVEYSIACRASSSFEAAKRLEQVYLDAYATKRATGSLQIWFPLATEQSEQLGFLREVEDRAIESVVRKLQRDVGYSTGPSRNFSGASDELQDTVQQRAEQLEKWREDATLEARKGTNWSHDWASRTHAYRTRPTLDELVHLSRGSRNED